jgi:hypothetical protein
MAMHARRLLQLLAGVAVLVLSPAAAIAAEGTSGAAGAGETSGSATAPPSTESTASTPPPAVQATPEETLNAPVVREHRARRPSAPGPASSPRRQKAPHKPAKPRQRTHKKAGASKSARRSGTPAPSPSAITPPLPLAFSGSLTGVPAFFIESFRIPPFLLPI